MTAMNSDMLEIVGQLHEGVVDDDAWQSAIGSLCTMLDIPFLLMGAVLKGGRGCEFEFGYRTARGAVALLEGPLADAEHNPWFTLAKSHPLRRVATVEDVGGQAFLETTKVWSDFYKPFGLGDTIGAPLERQPEFANVLVASRKVGKAGFGPEELRAVDLILPHLARAWRVKRKLTEMETLVGTLSFVLDRLERAVLVAGPDGEVRFANRAADRLLSRGDVIDARGGRLRAIRSHHSDALHALIEGAAKTGVGAASAAVDAVALPSTDERTPLAVVAEPLAPAHSDRLGHSSAAGAILYIGDSEASRCPPAERLSVVYGLTEAEARVAALVVEGESLTNASRRLGISPNTGKYHLKAVFEKVGVSRQTQLVRRVLADVGGLAEPDALRPAE